MHAISEDAEVLNELGYWLIPVGRDKRPTISSWGDLTGTHPNALKGVPFGIALITGRGLLIVDTDIKNGINGEAELVALFEKHGAGMPPEPVVRTGGGGSHYWFRVEDGRPTKNSQSKIAPGVDVRGDGGYAITAPSKHASGNRYQWLTEEIPALDDLPVAPPWLLNLIREDTPLEGGSRETPSPAFGGGVVGEGRRNGTLTSEVGRWLRSQDTLPDRDAAVSWARAWNAEHCDPPLDSTEVMATARSILKRETARRVNEGEGEFKPPNTGSLEDVFATIFEHDQSLNIGSWLRINNAPQANTYRLSTSRGQVKLPTLSRWTTCRDNFSAVGLWVRPRYAGQTKWRQPAQWLDQAAEEIDNSFDDGDDGAALDWINSWIMSGPRWLQLPELDPDSGQVKLSFHAFVTYLDSTRGGYRRTEADVRMSLRDAGFVKARDLWLKRSGYVSDDPGVYAAVSDALAQRAELEKARGHVTT